MASTLCGMHGTDLESLRAAADAGGITIAARRLGVAQSVVSRRIQRLEDELGVRLLDRSPSGIRPTPAGERVLAFARDTLDAYATLRADLAGAPSSPGGRVRVAASTIPGEHLAPGILARFGQLHPQVDVTLVVTDSAGVHEALLGGDAHVGFVGHHERRLADRFTSVAFADDEVVLAVPAGHPLASRTVVAMAALAGERLITRESGSGTQQTFLDALAHAGLALPQTASVSLGSSQAVISAVDAGLGIGIVSRRAIDDHRPGRVAAVRVRGVRVTRSLWLVYETRRPRTPAQAEFIAFATAEAGSRG